MHSNDILLARRDSYRAVILGHDGVVHLVWDELTIRLRPSEFIQMVRLLEEGVVELEMTEIRDGHLYLNQSETGEYRLGLGQIELSLSLMDFLNLVRAARAAARRLCAKSMGAFAAGDTALPAQRAFPG